MIQICIRILLIITLLHISSLFAQDKDSLTLYDITLDDLMSLRVESATKRTESITDVPASIVVITRSDIESQGWQTLEEVLCNIPGMYHINDYLWFGTDNFGVRGFFASGSFSSMIIMVNGVTQKEDWYNSFPLTKINVPVEAIDKIEVIRGPMSVIYGNNAFLGSINIVTNQSSGASMGSMGIGSNGVFSVFGRAAGEKDKVRYSVNLSSYGSNGISTPYSKLTSNFDDEWGLATNATSKGQLEDHRKYIDAWLAYDKIFFGYQQTYTNRGVIDYYPGYNDGHEAVIQSSNAVLGYRNSYASLLDYSASVKYYSFRNRLDYKHNSDTTAYGFNDIFSDAVDGELNLNINITKKWALTAGSCYRYVFRDKLVVDAPNLSDNYVNLDAGLDRDNKLQTWATYLQTSYNFSSMFSLLVGGRIEQTPSYKISYAVRFDPTEQYQYLFREGVYKYGQPYVIPRAALLFHINESNHLKLMYGMAVKQASIGENMDIVRYPERDHLKPAIMQTFEANYYGRFSQKAIINLSVFYNYANNLISRTNQMENGIMRLFNSNSGKLTTTGLEASIQFKPSPKINFTASVVYQNSNNLQEGYEGINLEYAPSVLAYSTLSYNLAKDITLGVSGYYVGEMETYWRPATRDPNNPDDNRDPIELIASGSRIGDKAPGYYVVNANIRAKNLFKSRFFCGVYIQNVLNQEVRYPTTRSNDIFEKGTLGYARYFSFSVGMYMSDI